VSAPYDVARVDELESFPGPGTLRWRPIRRRFGLTAFGINAYTADEAGRDVVEEHTEETYGHEEVYVVVAGRATFTLAGETFDAPTGTIVVIRDPKTKRHAAAAEPGTTVLAVGGRPGAHDPSAWEWSFAAYGYHQQGDTERGIAELREALEGGPKPDTRARLLYDLACLECLAGRGGETAVGYLLEAVELDAKYRRFASDDSDLDAIRDDPRFPR
jgi:mannose-6-phosphate isomerase-like protein (cupin superfamily)